MKNTVFIFITFSLLFITASLTGKSMRDQVMQFYQAVDAGDFDKAVSYLTDDVKVYLPLSPQPFDKMSYKQVGMGFKMGFPDMQHKILEFFEGENFVTYKAIFSGTNTGSLQGAPPTGNHVESPFLGFLKFNKSGKFTEINIQFDLAYFNAQIMAGMDPMPKIEVAKKNIIDAYEALNRRDWDAFAALCADNYTDVNVAPEPVVGIQAAIALYKQFVVGFPDFKLKVQDIAPVSVDRYLLRVSITGTHTGEFMGIPPTGKTIKFDDADLVELNAEGKCLRHTITNTGETLVQIGYGHLVDPNAMANEKIIRDFIATIDAGDIDQVVSFLASNHTHWFNGQELKGDDLKMRIKGFKTGFPDIQRSIDQIYVAGNTVAARGMVTGTHTGSFMGQNASGKKISFTWMAIYHLNAKGKIEKGWVEIDRATMEKQLSPNSTLNTTTSSNNH